MIALVPEVVFDEGKHHEANGSNGPTSRRSTYSPSLSAASRGLLAVRTFQSPPRDPFICFYVDEFYAVELAICPQLIALCVETHSLGDLLLVLTRTYPMAVLLLFVVRCVFMVRVITSVHGTPSSIITSS